ncbi:MAG: hypothetical protein WCF57_18295, partial [Pyrinomonadaceae bacterium]
MPGLWDDDAREVLRGGALIKKRLGYVHVASTAQWTHYAAAHHRGHTAMDEINVLPGYRGT